MRVKLILILFLAISAVVGVGYVSYLGLSNLMTTLAQTVQPDYREEELQKLLYHLSEAENSVRIYTITRESRYLRPYYANLRHADTLIQNLQNKSKKDAYLAYHIDTIKQFIRTKTNIQNRLIQLKQDQNRIDVYEELLAKIESLERKNAFIDSLKFAVEMAEITLENEISAKEKEIDLQENIPEPERPGFFKRLFGTAKKAEDAQITKEEDILKTSQELDTLIAAKDTLINIIDTLKKENITKQIEQTLAEIKIREEKIYQELAMIELALTRRDKAFGYRIQEQVTLLQDYFDQLDVGKAKAASNFFKETTDLIKIIGSISSMLFLVLVFIVMNDIKVNQRYRKDLEDAKVKAEKLAMAKEEFLSNMSHEIRTPMNAILGFVEQLSHAELNEQSRKQLNIIQNASKHLLAIINDILEFSKIDAGKIKLDNLPFSIEENAQIVYDTLYKNAIDKHLAFNLEITENVRAQFVLGDPVRLRQIIFNLADNAIKFTENGFVKIYLDRDNQHIILKVIDSGIGIDQAHKNLIFNKFDQATTNTSKKYGGTGLGLSIVKKLVDLQKGSIKVNSEIDKGTEFTVMLPFRPSSKVLPTDKQEIIAPVISVSKDTKILIVDDEEYNLLLMESIFKKRNIEYISARSGKEAIDIFQKEIFSLVLIDLQMSDVDGIEATTVIRKKYKSDLPIIATTANATHEIRNKCLEAGMNDVLIKPISEGELIKCLEVYLQLNNVPPIGINEDKADPKNQKAKNDQHDLSAIYSLFENDKALAISMANIYLKNLTSAVTSFKNRGKSSDLESISKTAHKLIPSTRHMGFDKLADQLKQLELTINDKAKKKLIDKQVNNMLIDAKEIIAQLKNILASADNTIDQ